MAIAIPPILGMGSQWIFLEFGISTRPSLFAKLIRIGINSTVITVDKRNVENKIIMKLQAVIIYEDLKRVCELTELVRFNEVYSGALT